MNCTSAPSKPAALLTWFINGDRGKQPAIKPNGFHITSVTIERGRSVSIGYSAPSSSGCGDFKEFLAF